MVARDIPVGARNEAEETVEFKHTLTSHHPELPPRQKKRNKLIAKVRSAVERPYAVFKENYGLRRMRFFNFARNQVLIVLACCAYNLRRAASALAAPRQACASI